MAMLSDKVLGVIVFEDDHEELVTDFYKDKDGSHLFVGEKHYLVVEVKGKDGFEWLTYEVIHTVNTKGQPFEAWAHVSMKYIEIQDGEDSLMSLVLS